MATHLPVPVVAEIGHGRVADAVADLTGRDITAAGRAADGKPLGIAVALDHAVIPRSRWSDTMLEADQTVEIVTAVQGG